VVLLGRGSERLGQQLVGLHSERELAAPGHERDPVDPDQVPQIEPEQPVHSVGAQLVDPGLELDPTRAVDQVQEGHLALAAPRGQPPGDAVANRRLVPGRKPRMGRPHSGDRLNAVELVGKRVDPGGAEGLELAPPRRQQVIRAVDPVGRIGHSRPYFDSTSILVILSRRSPLGVVITTSSPRLRPSSALPTGDSLDSLASAGLASAEPTIVYLTDLPPSSLTWTTEPTRTWSVPRSDWSITVAERSFSSSEAIRASSIACSFLASSYSAFSEMSPNSRASLIREATSRRRVVVRWSSSAFRLASPSGVMMTSLGMMQTCI